MVFEIGSHHKVSMPCSCVCVSIDNQIIAIIHSIRIYFGMRLTLSTHILWGAVGGLAHTKWFWFWHWPKTKMPLVSAWAQSFAAKIAPQPNSQMTRRHNRWMEQKERDRRQYNDTFNYWLFNKCEMRMFIIICNVYLSMEWETETINIILSCQNNSLYTAISVHYFGLLTKRFIEHIIFYMDL